MKTKIARNRKIRVLLESKHTDELNSFVEQFKTDVEKLLNYHIL